MDNTRLHTKLFNLLSILSCCYLLSICTTMAINKLGNKLAFSQIQLQFTQMGILTTITFIGTSIGYFWYVDKQLYHHINAHFSISLRSICITALLVTCSIILEALIMHGDFTLWPPCLDSIKQWAVNHDLAYQTFIKELSNAINTTSLFFGGVVTLAILPAIGEELLFRVILQNICAQKIKTPFFSISIVAMLFTLAHLRPYCSIMLFGMGVCLGSIYYITSNVALPIFGHLFNNCITLLFMFFSKKDIDPTLSATNFIKKLPLWSVITIAIICSFTIYLSFKKLIVWHKGKKISKKLS